MFRHAGVGGALLLAALGVSLGLAFGSRAVAAQTNPSPRPPLDATNQYLTSVAPQPTSPPGGGGTPIPGGPLATATNTARPRLTRTPSPTSTETHVPATETPAPTQTPFVVEQTVVQTVVQVVVETVMVSGTPVVVTVEATRVIEAPAASVDVPWWLWLLILFPLLALLAGLWLMRSRGAFLPGLYPLRGRPWREVAAPGRRRPHGRGE
jgi:hypothetical protein